MTDVTDEHSADAGASDLSANLERIWEEIKQISRQVERETRRSGRIARLRLEARQLRRDLAEWQARLGKAAYEAHASGGADQRLRDIEGLDEAVRALDDVGARLREKQQRIDELKTAAEAAGAEVREEPTGTDAGEAGEAATVAGDG